MLAVAHASDFLNVFRKHPKMLELQLARAHLPPADAPAGCTAITDSQGMIKVPASTLQTLPGFGDLDPKLFEGKTMRQMGRGQVEEEGNDIISCFVVADVGSAMIFQNSKHSYR